MQTFVFKVDWISHELLHKDGKVEGEDFFFFCLHQQQWPPLFYFFQCLGPTCPWCLWLFYSSGIGVPIMLAYVYGVVPISLCRSGGCGVSAGNGKGVRIEFDDENDMNVGSGAAATGKLQCPHLHPPLPHTDTQKWPCMFLLAKASKQQNLPFFSTDSLLSLFTWNLLAGFTDIRCSFTLSQKNILFVLLL